MADNRPDTAMLAPIEGIAQFIETCDENNLGGFAERNVVVIENFAPYLFAGPGAVTRWGTAMRAHVRGISGLRHRFGPAQNFQVTADTAFLSLPTNWTGFANGRHFDEDGGWAFVLVNQRGEWRVRNYGWAVTRMTIG